MVQWLWAMIRKMLGNLDWRLRLLSENGALGTSSLTMLHSQPIELDCGSSGSSLGRWLCSLQCTGLNWAGVQNITFISG